MLNLYELQATLSIGWFIISTSLIASLWLLLGLALCDIMAGDTDACSWTTKKSWASIQTLQSFRTNHLYFINNWALDVDSNSQHTKEYLWNGNRRMCLLFRWLIESLNQRTSQQLTVSIVWIHLQYKLSLSHSFICNRVVWREVSMAYEANYFSYYYRDKSLSFVNLRIISKKCLNTFRNSRNRKSRERSIRVKFTL